MSSDIELWNRTWANFWNWQCRDSTTMLFTISEYGLRTAVFGGRLHMVEWADGWCEARRGTGQLTHRQENSTVSAVWIAPRTLSIILRWLTSKGQRPLGSLGCEPPPTPCCPTVTGGLLADRLSANNRDWNISIIGKYDKQKKSTRRTNNIYHMTRLHCDAGTLVWNQLFNHVFGWLIIFNYNHYKTKTKGVEEQTQLKPSNGNKNKMIWNHI